MRRSPITTIAWTLPLILGGRSVRAQSAPAAVCAPTFELGENIPSRVAQRLRRVLDHAVGSLSSTSVCAPSHARLDWNDHELTIHIALEDGRIAVRNLESLEDVLPTLLSVLAVPAPDPAAPDPPVPFVAAAPVVAAVLLTPSSPIAPPLFPPPPPPAASGWSLLASLATGVSFQAGDNPLGRVGAEVGLATHRVALSARSSVAWALGDHRRMRFANPTVPRLAHDRMESSLVLSGRARLGSGRLRTEVGGFGGLSCNAAAADVEWTPRFGLEASLGLQLSRTLTVFARTEGYLDVGSGLGPGVALTLGATWEPQR
jgi:hypothetical protein